MSAVNLLEQYTWEKLIALLLTLLVTAVGVVVVIGWLIHSSLIIQVLSQYVPMQFNTAIGFILSGFGLLLIINSWLPRISLVSGIALTLLGALTMFQYFSSISLGIDTILQHHSINIGVSHTGRMAPNTAFCFTLAGLMIILLSLRIKSQNRYFFLLFPALGIAIFSITALVGYATNLPRLYSWGSLTGMAIHTATAFFLWSISSMLLIYSDIKSNPNTYKKSAYLLPVGVFLLVIFLFMGCWQLMVLKENRAIYHSLVNLKIQLIKSISNALTSRLQALERLGIRWENTKGGTPINIWQSDANAYINHNHDLAAIVLLNSQGKLIDIQSNTAKKDVAANFAHDKREIQHAISQAAQAPSPIITPPKLSASGMMGSWIVIPLKQQKHITGYAAIHYKYKALFSVSYPTLQDKLIHKVWRYQQNIVQQSNSAQIDRNNGQTQWQRDYLNQSTVMINGYPFQLTVWPSNTMLTATLLWLPSILLIVGFLLATLLAIILHLWQILKADMIKRKQIEQQIKDRSAELEASNKELEAFSYSVSHDLRAPLRHIIGFIGFLKNNKDNHFSEEGYRHLAIVEKAGTKLGCLIDELLHYSRAGRLQLNKKMIPLNNLVNEIKDEFTQDIEHRNIEIKVGSLPTVYADENMMRVVVANLLGNAIKFTRNEEKPMITFDSSLQDSMYTISVKDNGVGFDPKYKDKIFAVFQRLHKDAEFEGTGIGLANVARIIAKHGGSVGASSQLGNGTTVYFSIPRYEEA